jgi:hypothetical protein
VKNLPKPNAVKIAERSVRLVTDSIEQMVRGQVSAGLNHWNPLKFAICTCGWVGKAPARQIGTLADQHVADGCEGCDHAYYIEEVN